MAELKDCQQQETEGTLQFHSRLMLMDHRLQFATCCNLKVHMWGSYYSLNWVSVTCLCLKSLQGTRKQVECLHGTRWASLKSEGLV